MANALAVNSNDTLSGRSVIQQVHTYVGDLSSPASRIHLGESCPFRSWSRCRHGMEHGPAAGDHRGVRSGIPSPTGRVAARGVMCLAGNINGIWRRPGSQSESKRRSRPALG